jgi:hypothetical protein
MREPDLFLAFLAPLSDGAIPYMVTGTVASIAYGEPRLTHGIDLVVALEGDRIAEFVALYPVEEFQCPADAVIRAEVSKESGGCFRVVHRATGFSADINVAGEDSLDRWGMEGRREVEVEGCRVWLAPPEYVIVRKLQCYRDGGGAMQARDIERMLAISGEAIDRTALEAKVAELGLSETWQGLSGGEA